MTVGTLDLIDQAARDLAVRHQDGSLGEHEARSGIAELLLRSDVAAAVAGAFPSLSRQQRLDLRENLQAELVFRALDIESSFRLEVIAGGGSLCGWARQLAWKVARYDRAVRPRGMERATIVVDPQVPTRRDDDPRVYRDPAGKEYRAAVAFEGLSSEDVALSDWGDPDEFAWALERAEAVTGFAREPLRGHASASALREVLRLPALCVPDSSTERSEVLVRVLADETLARRSLVQMAASVCVEPPSLPCPGEEPVGELLMSLWDDFHPHHLESLMVRPPQAAHLLVVDSLAPLPKPSRGAVRALTRAVRQSSPASGWVSVQEGLVVAFLATCTEAVSRFDDTNGAEEKAAKEAAAREAAARWPILAARVASFPGAPLGSCVEEVEDRLRGLLERSRTTEVEARMSQRRRRGFATEERAA